jgi:hypothetical protein
MKNKLFYTLFFLSSLLSSCSITKFYNYALPFTNVEKIISLNKGETISEVNSKLGINPYNVLHLSEDGSMVLIYHYRTQQRKLESKNFIQPEERQAYLESDEYQNGGKLVYRLDVEKVCVFFRNGRMVSYITTDGFNSSEFQLYFNHQLKLISEGKFEPFTIERLRRFINEVTDEKIKQSTNPIQNDRRQGSLLPQLENKDLGSIQSEEVQLASHKKAHKGIFSRNSKK